MSMFYQCVVIQSLHGKSSVAYSGTKSECKEWVEKLPESLKDQFMIYSVLLTD